jgi:hypothetical protein
MGFVRKTCALEDRPFKLRQPSHAATGPLLCIAEAVAFMHHVSLVDPNRPSPRVTLSWLGEQVTSRRSRSHDDAGHATVHRDVQKLLSGFAGRMHVTEVKTFRFDQRCKVEQHGEKWVPNPMQQCPLSGDHGL